jgi:hypothetical protein
MKSILNAVDKNFLEKNHEGKEMEIIYYPLNLGFLKLEYGLFDNPGILSLVSFVLDDIEDAIAVGPRLEMCLSQDDAESVVTFITENGVSGLQWLDGEVTWGHTYDDDSSASDGKKIGLGEWIDECIDKMINPDDNEIEERRKYDNEDPEYMELLKERKNLEKI